MTKKTTSITVPQMAPKFFSDAVLDHVNNYEEREPGQWSKLEYIINDLCIEYPHPAQETITSFLCRMNEYTFGCVARQDRHFLMAQSAWQMLIISKYFDANRLAEYLN